MQTSRFFVANLPPHTKEKELSELFQNYGQVIRVELKTKENLNEENTKIIAFVTLKIDANDVQYCLDEVNWQKLNDAKIKVSLAKESFLERLKREREEAEAATVGGESSHQISEELENISELLRGNAENTRKKFDDDVELDENEVLVTKKRAARSMYNGKIFIERSDLPPVHVIETKKHVKHVDGKSSVAEQKRKQSVKNMKDQYEQKKSAIQHALADLGSAASKKIKFSDAEDEGIDEVVKSKTNIFESDDEVDGTVTLNLKAEHFGKKGEKLVQLQSKQSLDPRFKIDAKFIDDDEDDETAINEAQQTNDVNDERDWQLSILEQVVGTRPNPESTAQKAAKNKKMLRFDPAKEEHQKLMQCHQDKTKATNVRKLQNKTENKEKQEENRSEGLSNHSTTKVSKEVFYVVADTLAESLKTRGDGFSLLDMFGKADELVEKREDDLKKVSNAKILVNQRDKHIYTALGDDSEADSDIEPEPDSTTDLKQTNVKDPKNSKGKVKIALESFFIPKNDVRLKEGAKFFKFTKSTEMEENYEEVRNRLKMLIKTKIKKSSKNLSGGKRKVN